MCECCCCGTKKKAKKKTVKKKKKWFWKHFLCQEPPVIDRVECEATPCYPSRLTCGSWACSEFSHNQYLKASRDLPPAIGWLENSDILFFSAARRDSSRRSSIFICLFMYTTNQTRNETKIISWDRWLRPQLQWKRKKCTFVIHMAYNL